MGWRYKAGLLLIGTVVIKWVTSAEVTQDIFTAYHYQQPFAVTYLGASLMIVYLPVAFLKDWLCRYLEQRRSSRSNKVPALTDESSGEIGSPLRHKIIEIGLQGTITRKDSEEDFASQEEDARPLIGKGNQETQTPKQWKEITTKHIAMYGLDLAPIWFVTEEKMLRHYSSKQEILLVGEGDFSFSLCLASAFGSATNITATSLDSEDELCTKYMDAMGNVSILKRYGCDVQHEVDVHTMSFDNSLSLRRYDRIVFNFPHAGSRFFGRELSERAIEGHRVLVQGFLENAKEMLKENGEIHITHKTTYPFSHWKIKNLAKKEGLKLVKESEFKLSHYPGYTNKRGSGGRKSDDDFPVGACSTLMFKQRNR